MEQKTAVKIAKQPELENFKQLLSTWYYFIASYNCESRSLLAGKNITGEVALADTKS